MRKLAQYLHGVFALALAGQHHLLPVHPRPLPFEQAVHAFGRVGAQCFLQHVFNVVGRFIRRARFVGRGLQRGQQIGQPRLAFKARGGGIGQQAGQLAHHVGNLKRALHAGLRRHARRARHVQPVVFKGAGEFGCCRAVELAVFARCHRQSVRGLGVLAHLVPAHTVGQHALHGVDGRVGAAAVGIDQRLNQRAGLRQPLALQPLGIAAARFAVRCPGGFPQAVIQRFVALHFGLHGHIARRRSCCGRCANPSDAPHRAPEAPLCLHALVEFGIQFGNAAARGDGGACQIVVRCAAAARQALVGVLRF